MLIELPHIASLRDDEREVIALRSDDGISWHEHPVTASEIVTGLLKFAGEYCHSDHYWGEREQLSSKLTVIHAVL